MNGSNECSTSSSENTPPDKNGQIMPGGKFFIYTFSKQKTKKSYNGKILLNLDFQTILGHQKLTSSVSAPLQDFKTDFYSDLNTSSNDSPTKCILNNHKMEERKR